MFMLLKTLHLHIKGFLYSYSKKWIKFENQILYIAFAYYRQIFFNINIVKFCPQSLNSHYCNLSHSRFLMGLKNHEIQLMESLMNFILKVTKVIFPLYEIYSKVCLFTFIFILIDFFWSSSSWKKPHFGLLHIDFQTLSFLKSLRSCSQQSLSPVDLLLFLYWGCSKYFFSFYFSSHIVNSHGI